MRPTSGALLRTATLGLTLGLVLGGCDGAKVVAPPVDFNASDAAAAAESATSVPADTDALNSLGIAASALAGTVAVDLLPTTTGRTSLLPSYDQARRYATQTAGLPIFPSNLLGATLVYDTAVDHYVVDPAATGAPANGVRVIYYATDPVTQQPVLPLQPLGYIDLADQSTAASTRLGIKIVRTSPTSLVLADYYVDAAYAQTSTDITVTLSAVGSVSDGTDTLDFTLSQSVTVASSSSSMGLTIDYMVSHSGTGDSLHLVGTGQVLVGQEQPSSFDVTLTVVNAGATALLDASLAGDGAITGEIDYNGVKVIDIAGSADAPSFTRADGSALTQQDVQALHTLWHAIAGLFDFGDHVFRAFHYAHDH